LEWIWPLAAIATLFNRYPANDKSSMASQEARDPKQRPQRDQGKIHLSHVKLWVPQGVGRRLRETGRLRALQGVPIPPGAQNRPVQRALAFRPPTPAVEQIYMHSFNESLGHYRSLLLEEGEGRLHLPNDNLDTGERTGPAAYRLADQTYANLLGHD